MQVFIGYASLSGNTEKMAFVIKKRLMAVGCKVHMEELDTVEVDTLKEFDLAFFGLYIKKNYFMKRRNFMKRLDKYIFPA